MSLKNSILRKLGVKTKRMFIVQIELAGKCSASCEFCEWWERPDSEKIFMDMALAKKCVKEAKELNPEFISLHVTGESLHHPDYLDIIPSDHPVIISTNCLALKGKIAERIAAMDNVVLVMAVLWSEPPARFAESLRNAYMFLAMLNPQCKTISIQMICSKTSILHAQKMYDVFFPFLKKYPQLHLIYHQPYSVRADGLTQGYIPTGIPESNRVVIERTKTPKTCGDECANLPCNPTTSIIIQSDGQIRPCCVRWENWNIGNAKTMTIREAWESKRMKEYREIWEYGDKKGEMAGLRCNYMTRKPS